MHYPSGEQLSIYDAAMRYQAEGVPLVVFAGKEYGTGSSRDWAAKGTRLLGVRAVIAESFERIHRSNLVGMGVLPLVFAEGMSWQALGLKGDETREPQGPRATSSRGSGSRPTSPTPTARRAPCRCARRSIRSTSSTISAMAAFCTTCCAASPGMRPSANFSLR